MPRQLQPTRAGWMFLLIIMGVGFAALNTGNNLLYVVLSLLLAFLVLSGVLSESALRGIEVRRTPPREILAEARNPLLIEILNNQRRIPAFAVEVEDLGSPDSPALAGAEEPRGQGVRRVHELGRVFALRIGPGATEARAYSLVPPGRGELHFHGVRVATRFPFGLFMKSRTIEIAETTLVYPAILDLGPPPPPRSSRNHAGNATIRRGEGSDIAGLREYAVGDSMRRVHWRSSLRRGDLFVRDPEEERSSELIVRLRTRAAGGTDPGKLNEASEQAHADFERRVSLAATEVATQLEAGLRVGLVTDHERIAPEAGPHQRTRLLSLLARVALRPGDIARSAHDEEEAPPQMRRAL
jgi:uncharacterized protein (DUF58 family)